MIMELIPSDGTLVDDGQSIDLDGDALDMLLKTEDDLTRLLWDDDASLAVVVGEAEPPAIDRDVSLSPSSSDASEAAATQTRKQPQKNPSRERMKAELAFLRRHVVELETELAELRQERQHPDLPIAMAVPTTTMWRQIASEQLSLRRDAEIENSRLKRVLEDHSRLAQSLNELMRKRSSATVVELFEETRKRTRFACDLSDFQALQSRFRIEIQDAYSILDDVLEASGLATAQPDAANGFAVQTKQPTSSGGEAFVEVTSVTHSPFDFARSSEAVWQSITRETLRYPRRVQTCTMEGDYLAVKYDRELRRSADQHGIETSTFVVRRFLDTAPRKRLVLVWRGTTQADDTSGEWQNAYTDETGWVVLSPMSGGDGTLMRSCVHLVPRPLKKPAIGSNELAQLPPASRICEYAVTAHEEDVNAITQAVAKFFLTDTVV
ncbi:hypothetical protein P43SY_006793 [Pythium insidiosum]|uniref:M96 mating-specific protein family n=1 Tax=Pythium insidiosum TaxID=114742 RepID=A0AAD5LKU9_PYTIN|nr:hypothetical protein P43SY_006793 [Pythium insidiosum]